MSSNNLDEKSISILNLLKEQGALWVREVGNRAQIRRADVINRLRSLLRAGYTRCLEERREHGRKYYDITPKAKRYLRALEDRKKQEGIEVLKAQFAGMSAEELTEFYDAIESDFGDWFEMIRESEPRLASFFVKLPMHSEEYDGTITIKWQLTAKGMKEMPKLKVDKPIPVLRVYPDGRQEWCPKK